MAREFQMGARMTLKDQFSKQLRNVKRATNSFKTSVEGTNTETAEMVNKQLRAKDSMDRFGRETNQATNNLKEQRTATNRLGSSMRTVKGLIVGVASSMAALTAKRWFIDTNAEMESYENTLRVVLGTQEEAVKQLEWAKDFAKGTPFQLEGIVEATTRLESYGLQSEKVLGITGDMASVMGKDLMQAVEAVADAQTGEVERLKEFGITKDMIKEQAEALGTMPINNKGQITDMKAFNAALFKLMEDRFEGGMEMQMKSWKGIISNTKDYINEIKRTIGAPIFEEAKEQARSFRNTLDNLIKSGTIDEWAENVAAGIETFKTSFKTYAKPAIEGLVAGAKLIKDNWDWLGPFVQGLVVTWGSYYAITKAVAAYQAIATGIQWAYNAAITAYQSIGLIAIGVTEGWTGVQAALNAVLAANPIGLVVGAIALLVGGLILAYKKSETFRNIVNSVWSSIWARVKPIVDSLRNTIISAFTEVYNWVQTYWPKIYTILTWVWAVIGPYITATVKNLGLIIEGGFNLIVSIVKRTMGMVGGIIRIAWSLISGIFGIGLSLLTGDWQGAWDAMLGMLEGVWTGIKQFFTNLGGLFLDAGSTIINTLVQGIKNTAMAPVNAVKNVFNKVRNLLPFSDAKEGPFADLTGSGQSIIRTVIKGIRGEAGRLYSIVTEVFENVKEFATSPIRAILDIVNQVTNGIKSGIAGVYNKVIGIIDKIPKMFLPKELEDLEPIKIETDVKEKEFSASNNRDFKEPPAVSSSPENINPGGGTTNNRTSNNRTVIQNLIGTLELKDVGDRDVEDLLEELITMLYNRLSDADEIISTGEMGVLLNE